MIFHHFSWIFNEKSWIRALRSLRRRRGVLAGLRRRRGEGLLHGIEQRRDGVCVVEPLGTPGAYAPKRVRRVTKRGGNPEGAQQVHEHRLLSRVPPNSSPEPRSVRPDHPRG